jgi:PAS domain S-box-containing protein
MSQWLMAALAAGLTTFTVVSLLYFHIFAKYRERFLLYWALAWAVHALRNGAILSTAYFGPSKSVMILEQWLVLAVSCLLLGGAVQFAGSRFPRWLPLAVAAAAGWVPLGVLTGVGAPWLYIPIYFFFGFSQIVSGAVILRHMPRQGLGRRTCGWSLIVWGVHHLDYPFLRPIAWLAPWGFLIGAALALASSISLLLIYLEKLKNDLELSELRFKRFVENSMDGLVMAGPDGGVIDVNDETCRMAMRPREALVGQRVAGLFRPGDGSNPVETLADIPDGGALSEELILVREAGTGLPVEVKASAFMGGGVRLTLLCMRDMAARKRAELERESSLREKTVLLKEVHHRVKNNLQMLQSLIDLQGMDADDPRVSDVLAKVHVRIRAIALVHEKLYGQGDLSRIMLDEYVPELLEQITLLFSGKAAGVERRLDIAPLAAALETAIPFGLLVTELVTNSYKHVFSANGGGVLTVGLSERGGESVLAVRDGGHGPPRDIFLPGSPTLGGQLVAALAGQIGGRVEVVNGDMAGVEIFFPSSRLSSLHPAH